MKIDIKKYDKVITIILVGILILIVIMPVKENSTGTQSSSEEVADYNQYINYYEEKLKNTLESSYGAGTMQVMIHLKEQENRESIYSSSNEQATVDGVLIVADVDDKDAISEITFAVCALFDLPTHKVAVMIKN